MQDLNDKVQGAKLTALEWNEVPSEIQNVIESTGQSLTSGDLQQLLKAIAEYASNGDYYDDVGLADAYILVPGNSRGGIQQYTEGMQIRFNIANTNTGPSTININGVGVVDIRKANGSALIAGDLVAGDAAVLSYVAGSNYFRIVLSGDDALSGLILFGGEFDASGGVFPAPQVPASSEIWITVVAGVVSAIPFAVGDRLYYDGNTTNYSNIGQGSGVTSVNSKTGAVQLDAPDIPFLSGAGLSATDVGGGLDELQTEKTDTIAAGNGLTGGGSGPSISLDIGAGTGITVDSDSISLDTAYTDTLYADINAEYSQLFFAGSQKVYTKSNGAVVVGELESTTWRATSDARLKENIRDLDYQDCKNILSRIQWIMFDWKNGFSKDDVGLLAQKLLEICPDAVKENDDGILGVDYNYLFKMQMRVCQNMETRLRILERQFEAFIMSK